MISRLVLFLSLGCVSALSLHAVTSDILPPSRRKPTVELAASLATATPVAPLKGDLISPFSPPGFSAPDPEELAAQLAAKNASSQIAKPASDHDILAIISEKLTPSGTATLGGEQVLIFPSKRLRKGDHFVISYEGRDFDLELTDIQPTTFSLRLNRAEITRPIKLGRTK